MKTVALLLSLLLVATPAFAWTDVYSWDASAGATSYRIEKSTDNGAIWSLAGTVTTPTFTYTGTETGLTLFRVSSCNSAGCTVRAASGLWHDESKQPPLATGNLQVQ